MYIDYTFVMDEGKHELNYRVEFERPRKAQLELAKYPMWTQLVFSQCPHCPLSPDEYSHCPVAIDAHEIVTEFSAILSCKEADIAIETPERNYSKHTDAQTGLRSLIGFVMASSACPLMKPMRGMAYYHQPFASLDETVYRMASSYLMSQYFKLKRGETPDFKLEGLKKYHESIQVLNRYFLERVRTACEADASLNVLATLFTISSMLSLSLERQLNQLEHLFSE